MTEIHDSIALIYYLIFIIIYYISIMYYRNNDLTGWGFWRCPGNAPALSRQFQQVTQVVRLPSPLRAVVHLELPLLRRQLQFHRADVRLYLVPGSPLPRRTSKMKIIISIHVDPRNRAQSLCRYRLQFYKQLSVLRWFSQLEMKKFQMNGVTKIF